MKNKYGSLFNVLLTDEEVSKLREKFPDWQKRVESASVYLAAKGDKYKSHYAMLLNWARMEEERKAEKMAAEPVPKYQQFLDLAKGLENEQY